ncbi:hypothetical protein BVZ53_01390B, partial [Haemophilus influenzae]
AKAFYRRPSSIG